MNTFKFNIIIQFNMDIYKNAQSYNSSVWNPSMSNTTVVTLGLSRYIELISSLVIKNKVPEKRNDILL